MRRPRLPYHAREQAPGSVTLLKAPIGFGKSTLLRQWAADARARHEKVAFLSLTAADVSIEGLSAHCKKVAAALGVRPRGSTVTHPNCIEQLLCGDRAAELTLFVDNWDEIRESESERRIAAIMAAGQLRAKLCIASRRACGLPLDTLLTEHRLRVIGQNALKFSDAEQRRLLGPALWGVTSAQLIHACDGWPLALLLLKSVERGEASDSKQPAVFARRSGLEEIVAKKLLQACTPREIELLDVLGFSAEFDVPLLNEVRDAADSDELLEGVASLLPFDLHDDDSGLRYRPAALLRAILKRRFDAIGSSRQETIASRAFQRALRQGRSLDAINFALLSGDADRAIELFEAIGPMRLIMMYGVEPIQDALRRVPVAMLANSPRLKLAIPVTFAKRGCLAEAREMVDATIHEIEVSSIGPVSRRLALLDSVFVKMQVSACTNRGWADDYEHEAAAELAKEPAFAAWSTVISGVVQHQIGRLDEAEALFDRAQFSCQQIRADYQLVHLQMHRAHVELARGRLRAAARMFREVKCSVTASYPSDVGLLAVADLGLIEVSLLTSRFSVPLETIDGALAHLKQSDSWYEPIAGGLVSLSRCLWRDRGVEGVMSGLDAAEADLRQRSITVVSGLAGVLRTFYLALAGRIDTAESLLQIAEREERQGDDSRLFWRERHFKGLAISMLAAAKGDRPAALAAADRLIEEGRRDGRRIALIEAYLNRARIILAPCATRTEGLVPIALALELACDLGACGSLYEWRDLIEGHALALQPDLQPRTRAMLVRICVEWRGKLHPGLSSKELNVLRGVATGLTNKQISRELDVSVETIKFHLKQCFRKLNAQTRADAVQKARNAELI